MHGRAGEEGSNQLGIRHMRPAPSRLAPATARDSDPSSSSPASSSTPFFCKDGRKISIGDCALFKLPQDSLPSIGLVCRVTVTREKNFKLSVNWLYRPTELKLVKDIQLEAAPNEIFYSLKKDEIPAESLLHPCKVAFLPKGVELPSGISSFVCRRVYDIEKRCLWWLTDKEHFNEKVDQLFYKTQIEMHASAQPNGRSPKQLTGQMPTSHLKSGSDSVNAAAVLSQSKGKKRERSDPSTDPVKRERSSKSEDGDSGRCSLEKVVEKGPLVDNEGVDRLVQAMFFEINERRIDLPARTTLTSIIAATEKPDCLSRFVQIRGLSVLDDWLQDVHKGKTGDSSGVKENDKLVEEFLLVLLRALDKLPVNLPALQMCNIGKSVNHLRTHKNLEIQKKARSLVDTWKKRVEAEMNIHDAKVGSNQAVSGSSRSRLPEAPHVNKSTGGSPEGAPKSPTVPLSASKASPAKFLQGETASKSTSQSQGSMKLATPEISAGGHMKDGQPRLSSSLSDVPLTTSRDDKSSSSSPSHNSSQSFPGDHVRNGVSAVKEDVRSSVATPSKMPFSPSRHRKSVNGFPASVASARESVLSRAVSLHKNVAPDKASQSGLTSEKAADVAPEVNSHKFIVKIPNRGRSPAQRAAGGSVDDNSIMNSQPSSPVVLERPDQVDAVLEERDDAPQANASSEAIAESSQQDDCREPLPACEEFDCQVDPGPNEDHCNANEIAKETEAVSKNIASTRNTLRLGKAPEESMSPMKALLESCVNCAEASAPVPIGDNTGMQLLASVAAGEVFKSELASPGNSLPGNASPTEPSRKANDLEERPSSLESQSFKGVGSECIQKDSEDSCLLSPKADVKTSTLGFPERAGEELDKQLDSSSVGVDQTAALSNGTDKVRKSLAEGTTVSETFVQSVEAKELQKNAASLEGPHLDGIANVKARIDGLILPEHRTIDEKLRCESKEETAEMGSLYGREGMKLDKDSGVLVEAQPAGRILSESIDEQKSKTANRLMEETVAGPTSGKEEHMELEAAPEKKVGCSEPTSCLTGLNMNMKGMFSGSEVSKKEGSDMEKCCSSRSHASLEGLPDGYLKLKFDLNEGFSPEDGKFGETINFNPPPVSAAALPLVSQLPFGPASSSASLSVPIAVAAAAAKVPFVPPGDLLRAKVEIGWKGSAATSAFRPAEPRKITEMPTGTAFTVASDISSGRQSRALLDFDLNVADDKIIEDAAPHGSPRGNYEKTLPETTDSAASRASGGLGLDLNCVDEAPTDSVNCQSSNGCKQDSGAFRDFDLNDRPWMDTAEPSTSGQQPERSSLLSHQQPVGLRVHGAEMGNFSPWFHPASNYSAVTVPSVLSDRVEQPFPVIAGGVPPRMLRPSGAGGIPFNAEMYRGPVLSSSPALPFPSAPFQYSIFPFGTSFPLPSATLSGTPATYVDPSSGGRLGFPSAHSQFMGPPGPVTSQLSRPYIVSHSDGSGNGALESGKKLNRQGLDLNSGPGGPDLEGRDETAPIGLRQLSMGGPQTLADEQARFNQLNSGLLKRKEPEGGRDGYWHTSWQQ